MTQTATDWIWRLGWIKAWTDIPILWLRRKDREGHDQSWMAIMTKTVTSMALKFGPTGGAPEVLKTFAVQDADEARAIAKAQALPLLTDDYYHPVRRPHFTGAFTLERAAWEHFARVLDRFHLSAPRLGTEIVDIIPPGFPHLVDPDFGLTLCAHPVGNHHVRIEYGVQLSWEDDDPDVQGLIDFAALYHIISAVREDDLAGPLVHEASTTLRSLRRELSPEIVGLAIELGLLPTELDIPALAGRSGDGRWDSLI